MLLRSTGFQRTVSGPPPQDFSFLASGAWDLKWVLLRVSTTRIQDTERDAQRIRLVLVPLHQHHSHHVIRTLRMQYIMIAMGYSHRDRLNPETAN